jgi:hypothetical protein
MTLAKLLAVGMIPAIWVPPLHVRELRALINHRQRLIAQQTRITQSWRTAPGKTGCTVACTAIIWSRPAGNCSEPPTGPGGWGYP